MRTSRFHCHSAELPLSLLLRRAQRTLWCAMILAIAAHLLLSRLRSGHAPRQAARPLTRQFMKRRPRLTKPLELKKRPRPRQRQVHREMISVEARHDRREQGGGVRPTSVVARLARPE